MTLENKQSIRICFTQYVLPSVAAMWFYTIYTIWGISRDKPLISPRLPA